MRTKLLGALRWALIALLISPLVAAFAKTWGHRRSTPPAPTAAPHAWVPHALVLAEPSWSPPRLHHTAHPVRHATHAQPVVRHVHHRVSPAPVAAAPQPVAQLASLPLQTHHTTARVTTPVHRVHRVTTPKPVAKPQPKPRSKPAPKLTPTPVPSPTPSPATPTPTPAPAAPASPPTSGPATVPTTTPAPPVVTAPPPASTPPSTPTTPPPTATPPVAATPPAETRPGNGYGDKNHTHTGPPGQPK